MVNKDCFAYRETTGGAVCTALKELYCYNCAFYKTEIDGLPPKKRLYDSRITDEEKEEIIRLYKEGVSRNEIARRFGIAYKTVWKIINGYEEGSEGKWTD